jgi:hypothetical protein
MIQPNSQPETRQAVLSRRLTSPGDTTQEGHDQPTRMHLSAKPPAKSNFSTHLGITIRWWAAPPGDLAVAVGSAAVTSQDSSGAGARAAACPVPAEQGGGATC